MNKSNKAYFILFANCIPVKGYYRSVIMDLQKNSYLTIPNLLFDVLSLDLRNNTVSDLKKYFNEEYNEGINSFFSYLEKEEYGFFTNEPNNFPEIDTDFLLPFTIATSIININIQSRFNLISVLTQLIDMGCQLVQIRINKKIQFDELNKSLKVITNSRILLVELYLKDFNYSINEIKKFIKKYFRLKLILFSSKNKSEINKEQLTNVFFIEDNLSLHQKEMVDQRLFISNIMFYVESKNYNIGLNRKVCIDYDGAIKNFVNHSKVYGNVLNKKIKDIIKLSEFQKKWFINNSNIEKCKDCEFRYMCLSNSDIIVDNSKFYKIDKCYYDPYRGVWK